MVRVNVNAEQARFWDEEAGPTGHVVGLDISQVMLARAFALADPGLMSRPAFRLRARRGCRIDR
jgi:hypothetical protein